MSGEDVMLTTVTCNACGRTWVATENDDDPSSKRTSKGIVCANCGEADVWHVGVTKIEPRQG